MQRLRSLPALVLALLLTGGAAAHASDGARVLIEFHPGGKGAVQQALGGAGAQIHYQFDNLRVIAATVPSAALQGLAKNPNVALIEEDARRYPMGQTVPYGIDSVQARDVWDANRDGAIDAGAPTGAGRIVCVIDSGLETNHEDFAGVSVIGGHPSGWNTDKCGHGTHVAGSIAAANNDVGVVGVSPGGVSLYIVKVFGDTCGWTYSSGLMDAANRCAAAGAHVINMSLGGSRAVKSEERGFQDLYNAGLLSVAAAGNDGSNRRSYPASYPSVISVAAVDSNHVVAGFSQKNADVELSAPGVAVLSTVPWKATDSLTAAGVTYDGNKIEHATDGTGSGALADGGLCTSTNGIWSGRVVLCERGQVSFLDKVRNVQNSGGVAAVIYNNEPGNFFGTLGDGNSSTIPAISLSQEDGQFLVANQLGASGTVESSFDPNGSGYEAWDGTSMASPHVAGVAALVWSSDSSRTNAEIRDILASTALDLGPAGRDNSYGYGLVQAYDAWIALGGGAGDPGDPSDPGDPGDPGDPSDPGDPGDPGDDTTAPVISDVSSAVVHKNGRFEITWSTDEPATSEVVFSCCGTFTDSTLETSHKMTFNGSKNVTYEYWVSSTDASGNKATEGPFYHQN